MLSRTAKLTLCLFAGLLLCAAKPKPSKGGFDFTSDQPFGFGMQQQDAEQVLQDANNWKITYRIDTPSTSEIACIYQDTSFYHLSFYQGECYAIEKRVQVPQAEVERVFTYYAGQLGQTGEATQSQDNSLYFSRWTKGPSEISLTANQGTGDIYKLTYEQEDILKSGDARHAQQDELSSTPQTVDPITGKPRLFPRAGDPGQGDGSQADGSGDNGAGASDGTGNADASGKGDGSADPNQGKPDDTGKDKPAKGKKAPKAKKDKGGGADSSGDGSDDSAKSKDHGIGHDDPNNW